MPQSFAGAAAPEMSPQETAVRTEVAKALVARLGHAKPLEQVYAAIAGKVIWDNQWQPVNVADLIDGLGLQTPASRMASAYETSSPAASGIPMPSAQVKPGRAQTSEYAELRRLEAAGALTAGQRIALGLARAAAEQAAQEATATGAEGGDA